MVMHRSAQHAAEAAAAEESQRLRRAAAQEVMLKETFLEAVEAEKERLLLARDQALQYRPSSSSSAPQVGSHSSRNPSLFSLMSIHVVIVSRIHATELWCFRNSRPSAKHLHSSCTPICFVLLYMVPRNTICVCVAACMFIKRM